MDNTFVHSTEEEHMDDLMELFKVLLKYGLKISLHKCKFYKTKIVYMGLKFQVKDDKICYTPLKDKCEAIQNLDSPRTLKQTRAFCGMVNLLSSFYQTCNDYLYIYMICTKKSRNSNGQWKMRKHVMTLKTY